MKFLIAALLLTSLSVQARLTEGDFSGDVIQSGRTLSVDTGKITNAMLAGSIDLTTKVTGRLPKALAPLQSIPSSDITAIITANYTIGANDYMVRYDSHLGAFNIQLPDPTLSNRRLIFIDTRAAEFDSLGVSLLRFGSEKIGGAAATKVISANSGVESGIELISDGTHWRQIGITF